MAMERMRRLVRESQGSVIQEWMTNPDEPECGIGRSILTWAKLNVSSGWIVNHEPMLLSATHRDWMKNIGLPDESDLYLHSESAYRQISLENLETGTNWRGRTGPGVIFLDLLQRNKNYGGPFISELTKAAYERDFRLDTLRYVYVTDIGNEDTRAYIEKWVYKPGSNIGDHGRSYPPESETFRGLLGTEIGNIVAFFILGAYGRGVKRISLIHVFRADDAYQMKFKVIDV